MNKKLIIAVAVIVALVGGYTALYFSSIFPITSIEVAGVAKLQSDYVLDLAEVPKDSTILRTDVEGIEARLLSEPWIQDVKVERVFPSTLVLHVTEQPVAAVVDIVPETANDSGQQWAISETGLWIAKINRVSAEESSSKNTTTASTSTTAVEINKEELLMLPKVKDVSAAVRPEPGAQESDKGVTSALTLLREFSPEMREMVASISAPDASNIVLTLYNNVRVNFGTAEDIEAKERATATTLEGREETLISINVRIPERVTYKELPE